ncbi:hypothetical protein CLV62_101287 [Dysgonomonas alginatilytica]|uniref:Uncharacterized protein n=1 Tax=Dysgonomonas alginatilytica TaxID=1605892 RepID=A0A2V3PTJ8_9BACT|nr:hypothetical protein [Dysgonomonas alginatilytica]PXV69020.1 hypothetical protein CLV62_101287 [Dysgonomonas alginatilytica]
MKQIVLTFLFTLSLGQVLPQIGINTENPSAMFHIDGAMDNLASPTAAQILNDVVVTSAGNIGVGTVTPSVRLEIVKGASSPLRIVDGSTMTAKVLESDANGVAGWTEQPPSYAKSYRASAGGQKFYYATIAVLTMDQPIVIPQNGKYLLTLRWWGYNRLDVASRHILSGYIFVRKQGAGTVYLDQIEYYMNGTINDVLTFTTSLYLGDRVANEVIEILVRPAIGTDGTAGALQWELINNAARPDLMPQVILYSI